MFNIEELFLFKGLSEKEKGNILSELNSKTDFTKGHAIYDCSEFQKAMGILIKGKAAAYSEGVQKTEFKEGAVFGVASLFGCDGKYVSKIVALSNCEVLFVSEDLLKKIIINNPQCGLNYIEFLSNRIRYLNIRIGEFTGANVSGRLYKYFCENSDEKGIVHIGNMASLAKKMDIGRTSLYRALSELEEKGAVKRTDNDIQVI